MINIFGYFFLFSVVCRHRRKEFKVPDESSVNGLMDDLFGDMDEFENNQELLGNDWDNDDRGEQFTDSDDSSDEFDHDDLDTNEGEGTADTDTDADADDNDDNDQSPMESSSDSGESSILETIRKFTNEGDSSDSEYTGDDDDSEDENDVMFYSSEVGNSGSCNEDTIRKFGAESQDNEDKNNEAKKVCFLNNFTLTSLATSFFVFCIAIKTRW